MGNSLSVSGPNETVRGHLAGITEQPVSASNRKLSASRIAPRPPNRYIIAYLSSVMYSIIIIVVVYFAKMAHKIHTKIQR